MIGGRRMRRALAFLVTLSLAGCAATVPYTGVGPYPQLERGAPVLPVDVLGNVFSIIPKLLLWNRRVNLHYISPEVEDQLIAYLEARNLPVIDDAKFRLNQYRPGQDLSRLVKNRHVGWPYRLLIGFPVTLVFDVLLPGRLFPWGDYYNPYTNTVHLYSDHAAVALHEAGHVQDFSRRRFKGTYALLRLIPGVDLFQEYKATKEAIRYLKDTNDRETELAAYKVLYPAYGSYAGSYIFAPIGTLAGVLVGHAAGRSTAAVQKRQYEQHPLDPDSLTGANTEPAWSSVPIERQQEPLQPEPSAP
jgi:hypothetical protein